ncbi:MAG: hypothetical protein KDA51_18470 [Planctomycetales bacterium]|nr:hypothetical protein [Planctomycetales bacterium]
MISTDHRRIENSEEDYRLKISVGVDQTIRGLNFVTVRDRVEIYRELSRVIADIYSPLRS